MPDTYSYSLVVVVAATPAPTDGVDVLNADRLRLLNNDLAVLTDCFVVVIVAARDGAEPTKIPLTKGALIRMYERGELYPQAIAEIVEALTGEPDRIDLQVLLSRMYHQAGRQKEAIRTCEILLENSPYCYEANRILADHYTKLQDFENARQYTNKIEAIDPYNKFLSGDIDSPNNVAEDAVVIEKLLWEKQPDDELQPAWASNVGVNIQTDEDEELDWFPIQSETSEEEIYMDTKPDNNQMDDELPSESDNGLFDDQSLDPGDVPEWMQDAGWAASEESPDDSISDRS